MYPDRIYTVTPGSNSSAHNTVEPNYTDLTPFCFCKGTLIKTHDGERPVEEIDIGDLVWTLDKGMQPVSWVGKTIAKGGIARRVLIKKGALRNKRDLRVSPNHRMLISGWRAELLFGAAEILIPAKHLVNGRTILWEFSEQTEFVHMMFDTHEIVEADGCYSESFFVGGYGLDIMNCETRQELISMFPQLESAALPPFPTARYSTRSFEARLCIAN